MQSNDSALLLKHFSYFLRSRLKLLAWLIEHCLCQKVLDMRHIQKLFSSMQNQLEKSHKVFQLELIAGKNAAVIWGEWRVSLRIHNWQDYNFNQKTSSTWPKFSIGYSPYAVIPRKFFDFGKMFCFLWPLLGISKKSLPKSWMKKQQETHLEHNLGGTTNAEIGS